MLWKDHKVSLANSFGIQFTPASNNSIVMKFWIEAIYL